MNQAFAQVAGTPAGAPQPTIVGMVTPFLLMFGVMYFLIIRPQQKKLKDHQATLETIKYGDEIVTNSGIFGKITGITEQVLTVEIADGVRIKLLKGQVASINPKLGSEKGA